MSMDVSQYGFGQFGKENEDWPMVIVEYQISIQTPVVTNIMEI